MCFIIRSLSPDQVNKKRITKYILNTIDNNPIFLNKIKEEEEEIEENNKEIQSKICKSCGTNKTPRWHRLYIYQSDGFVCNACAIRLKKYKRKCSNCNYIVKKDATVCPKCFSTILIHIK